MAYIQKKTNAKGENVYKIKVSCGYDVNGKQITRTKTFKPDPKMTPKQVEKEVNRQAVLFENEVKQNNTTAKTEKFQVIAEEWLLKEEKLGNIKKSTLELYKGTKKRVCLGLGHLRIDKITRNHIQKLIDDLSTGADGLKALSTKSLKNYICFVSNVFNYAVDSEILSSNPCKRIKIPKTAKKARQFYTIEEEAELLKRLDEKNAPLNHRFFFTMMVYLGLRKGECLGIKWEDIDIEKGTVFICRQIQYRNSNTGVFETTPKSENGIRNLVLPQKAIDLLPLIKQEQETNKEKCGDLWNDNGYVITNWCGKPLFPGATYNYLKKFCKRENLTFKGIHSFRHTMITNLAHNNTDIATISSIAGHGNSAITMSIYTHELKQATAHGCNTMANLIDKATETMSE